MSVIFEAENYRGLKKVRWAPSGVCALVGPNGSGKTTLLRLPELFRYAVQRGFNEAVGIVGGFWGLRHLGAGSDVPVTLRVSNDVQSYLVRILTGKSHGIVSVEELLTFEGRPLLTRPFEQDVVFDEHGQSFPLLGGKLGLASLNERRFHSVSWSLDAVLNNSAAFGHYAMPSIRQNGSPIADDLLLNRDGLNAFSVLRNWKDRFAHALKYHFVVEALRRAFPGLFYDLEFETRSMTVSVNYQLPGNTQAYPAYTAPDGLLVGLLHLCAVAGAPSGSYVGLDEFENSLHPHAIRSLIGSIREWCADKDITVALATHSPVVLDSFNKEKENIFVMQPGEEVQPVRLTDLGSEDWLAAFSAGQIYADEEVGAPVTPDNPSKR